MDLTTMTDDELDTLRHEVAAEQDRRYVATTYPAQIELMARRYQQATGKADPPVQAAERGVGLRPDPEPPAA